MIDPGTLIRGALVNVATQVAMMLAPHLAVFACLVVLAVTLFGWKKVADVFGFDTEKIQDVIDDIAMVRAQKKIISDSEDMPIISDASPGSSATTYENGISSDYAYSIGSVDDATASQSSVDDSPVIGDVAVDDSAARCEACDMWQVVSEDQVNESGLWRCASCGHMNDSE